MLPTAAATHTVQNSPPDALWMPPITRKRIVDGTNSEKRTIPSPKPSKKTINSMKCGLSRMNAWTASVAASGMKSIIRIVS
jgi:hypothetical protein